MMLRLCTHFVSCFLMACVTQANQTENSHEKKLAVVRGTVVDSGSQSRIPKVLVVLKQGEEPGVGTYTDASGNFAFRSLKPGAYVVSAERDGFVADPKLQTQLITASLGEAGEPITIHLNRTGAVSGHVLDPDGGTVTGADVQLMPLQTKKRAKGAAGYAMSDDRGAYRAYNIPPGRYKLLVTYQTRHEPAVKIQREKDQAKETLVDAYGPTYYPGTLDPAQASAIQVDAGGDLQGIDVGLLHTRTVRVRGRVTGPEGSLSTPLVMVVLTPAGGGNPVDTRIGPDGSFELAPVLPGRYRLGAMAFLQQGKQLTANQQLDVGDSDVEGVQVALGRAQTVTGAVVIPADRKLSPGLIVLLQSRDQLRQFGDQAGGFAQLNEHGTFSIENVAPGNYDLVLGSVGKGDDLYVSSIRSGSVDVLASGISIGAAAAPAIEVTMKANGSAVDALVVNDKGKPVPESVVLLVPDPPRSSQLALHGECNTDASGKCTLLGIAPGDYHAIASVKGEPVDVRDPDTMTLLKEQGTAVSVVPGDEKSVKITVLKQDDR